MPYLASISRLGEMTSCGRSICCSTFRSAIPGIPWMALLISLPRVNMRFRSSPNSLMAMFAFVPDSMASIRWLIGWPISTFAPTMVPSFSRTSATSSLRERSFNSNGASISETFTPRACSSSSARPVLRATVCISGMESSSSSARCPILSLSSREMPGSEEILMVNEPSLKGGRNERPRVKKQPSATTNSPIVPPSTPFLCPNTKVSAEPYHCFILRATAESLFSLFCFFVFSFPNR
ncbi:unknown [Bacteroides uniformis CAG:3]|nr:unknown [Bacteroides uniformis CAG:3]